MECGVGRSEACHSALALVADAKDCAYVGVKLGPKEGRTQKSGGAPPA